MRFVLPYPPSANAYWTIMRAGRGPRARPMMVKTPEARLYQNTAYLQICRSLRTIKRPLFPEGRLVVSVQVYRPRRIGDLDNTLKVLLDALKGSVFADDDQVVELHARRLEDPADPRVVVTVEQEGANGTGTDRS